MPAPQVQPAQKKDDHAGQVQVRVLCQRYGGTKNPIGMKGDVIWVDVEEYKRCCGAPHATEPGKITGASLTLLADEVKAVAATAAVQKASQDKHMAAKERIAAMAAESQDVALINAEREAAAAAERVKQLKIALGK